MLCYEQNTRTTTHNLLSGNPSNRSRNLGLRFRDRQRRHRRNRRYLVYGDPLHRFGVCSAYYSVSSFQMPLKPQPRQSRLHHRRFLVPRFLDAVPGARNDHSLEERIPKRLLLPYLASNLVGGSA